MVQEYPDTIPAYFEEEIDPLSRHGVKVQRAQRQEFICSHIALTAQVYIVLRSSSQPYNITVIPGVCPESRPDLHGVCRIGIACAKPDRIIFPIRLAKACIGFFCL